MSFLTSYSILARRPKIRQRISLCEAPRPYPSFGGAGPVFIEIAAVENRAGPVFIEIAAVENGASSRGFLARG